MIHGHRVVLRAIERQDLPAYVEWLNDPTVLNYFGRYGPLSLVEEEQWYEEMLQDPRTLNFSVEFEGRHIGGAGFNEIDGRSASAEVGLFIGLPALWDQGLGSDVLHALLRFGFEQMNLNRIYLSVFARNERAVHLYEKVGFKHEGRWRQAEYRHGQYQDLLWMGILREEWTG
ncbi:MAG: GNAT family N-acetyltransferase [Anaerolineae bacterium]|nr:GNAT family N-acetyltransferase [Anaerolineae bacterium]